MSKELSEIRQKALKYKRVQSLMQHVNVSTLMEEHKRQLRNKATGCDGITKAAYGIKLQENAEELVASMKQHRYTPKPVRRTYIPKLNGKLRPLGIPSYEDRLVQAIMASALNAIYETRFLDCSCGFRPEKSAHEAVRYINHTIMKKNVNFVLEADIKGFFDNVDHEWLMRFLENDIQDKNFLYYVRKFLKAGYIEDGKKQESKTGTPQGGLISPVLANVYLHYVLDEWIKYCVVSKLKRHPGHEVYYVRYADDFLIMFQDEEDAHKVMGALKARLKHFSLELAEDKTRILPIGPTHGTKEDFDFLGFTFYNTKTRKGHYRVGVRTSQKKLKSKRQEAKRWLRTRFNKPVPETMKDIARALTGHSNYFGVNGNFRSIWKFYDYVKRATYRMLRRRSQVKKIKFEKFIRVWNYFIKPPHLTVDIWYVQPKIA